MVGHTSSLLGINILPGEFKSFPRFSYVGQHRPPNDVILHPRQAELGEAVRRQTSSHKLTFADQLGNKESLTEVIWAVGIENSKPPKSKIDASGMAVCDFCGQMERWIPLDQPKRFKDVLICLDIFWLGSSTEHQEAFHGDSRRLF